MEGVRDSIAPFSSIIDEDKAPTTAEYEGGAEASRATPTTTSNKYEWLSHGTRRVGFRAKIDVRFTVAWKRQANGARVDVWRCAEISGAATERLGLGLELHVHLESDDHLVLVTPARHCPRYAILNIGMRFSALAG